MPHPERTIDFTQLPNWTLLKEQYKRAHKKLPEEGQGMQIFRNGVNYFK
jgi:phosphoribosylformylglycinamidine synthase